MPDAFQIPVLPHVAKIAIAELDGAAKRSERLLRAIQEGVAACQIVMGQGIVRAQLNEAVVNLQALDVAPFEGEVVAHDPEHIDIVGEALQDLAEEFDLEVDLSAVGLPAR